jgi:hypothetical protein
MVWWVAGSIRVLVCSDGYYTKRVGVIIDTMGGVLGL